VLLAYDSFYWPPGGQGWPVSFFVVTLVFLFYLAAQLAGSRRERGRQHTPGPALAPELDPAGR
jgi:zinc/manganese transport system permease protein